MSSVIAKNMQVGTSGTANQNFTLYQPASPDGTVRLGVGNTGATTGDVVTVSSSGVTVTGTLTSSGVTTVPAGSAAAPSISPSGDSNTGMFFPAADTIAFATAGTEDMRIDSAGNVAIGTTSALTKFTVSGGYISQTDGTVRTYLGADGSGGSLVGTTTNQYFRFVTNDTERARIDSSGNLLVGTTSTTFNDAGMRIQPTGSGSSMQVNISNTGGGLALGLNTTANTNIQQFYRSNVTVGTISVTTTNTSYNTSSDYRLKEAVQPMTGALAKVAALKPVTYKWKSTGEASEGFIAHELAEVVPGCVTGEKDAVNEDGSIKPQGIDTSFLIATLTAAIQEQQALIQSLTQRIAALEAQGQ